MKRFLLLASTILVLSGCREAATLRYRLEIDAGGQEKREDLINATLRVLERRAEALGTEIEDKVIDGEGDQTTVSLVLSDLGMAQTFEEGLLQPFQLNIMRQANEGETPDIDVQGHGGFTATPVTQEHLLWVTGSTDTTTGKGAVNLLFTPKGLEFLKVVFAENQGKSLGLFVRGKLVSKLLVQDEKVGENITIAGIPTPELATIFADDVNVGVHVKFVPVQ